jgi:ubiquinone biosynthesis protein
MWLNQIESGKFTVHVDHSDLVSELQQYRLIANRAIVAVIVVAMMIGSAVAMGIAPTPELPYIPVFGAAGFTLAIVLGLYLILQLLRGSSDL